MALVLIYTQTGDPVKVGDTVVDFRGEPAVVTGWREPHKPSSTGRVRVREATHTHMEMEYFPSVYDLHFAELVNQTAQESEPMKAIYWTNVAVDHANNVNTSTLAFAVRVLPSTDFRLERRRASIAARRKARSMSPGVEVARVSVLTVERIEPNDSRL